MKYSLRPPEIPRAQAIFHRISLPCHNTDTVYCQLYWELTGKHTPSSTGSIFNSTLPVELDVYGKILPS